MKKILFASVILVSMAASSIVQADGGIDGIPPSLGADDGSIISVTPTSVPDASESPARPRWFFKKIFPGKLFPGKFFKGVDKDVSKATIFVGRTADYAATDAGHLASAGFKYTYSAVRSLDGKPHDVATDVDSGHVLPAAGAATVAAVSTGAVVGAVGIPLLPATALVVGTNTANRMICTDHTASPTLCTNVKNGLDFGKTDEKAPEGGQKFGMGVSATVGRAWHFLFVHHKKAQTTESNVTASVDSNPAVNATQIKPATIGTGATVVTDGGAAVMVDSSHPVTSVQANIAY